MRRTKEQLAYDYFSGAVTCGYIDKEIDCEYDASMGFLTICVKDSVSPRPVTINLGSISREMFGELFVSNPAKEKIEHELRMKESV